MNIKHTIALAALLSSVGLIGQAHAATVKTYTNKAHGYSLQYPATWTVKMKVSNADVEFVAPDTNAIVTAAATRGSATPTVVKAQQSKVLKGLGTPQGPVTFKAVAIHGIDYDLSEVVTKTKAGKLLDVVLLDTVHGAYLYDFEAFVLFHASTTKAETTAVQGILNSIQI